MVTVTTPAVAAKILSVTCDKCGFTHNYEENSLSDLCDREFISINETMGYSCNAALSNDKWRDGDRLTLDLCQVCAFELLGNFIRVSERYYPMGKPYEEGFDAAQKGEEDDKNPYNPKTHDDQNFQWQDGWNTYHATVAGVEAEERLLSS